MRETIISRETKETDITLALALEGSGEISIDTGVAFFDHMLEAMGRHGLFDLTIRAKGDLGVDAHHTVEDVGIVFGQAIAQCLGNRAGIKRFGDALICMDEALVLAAIDISGRGQLHWEVQLPIEFIGTFDTSLFKEFLIALYRPVRKCGHHPARALAVRRERASHHRGGRKGGCQGAL